MASFILRDIDDKFWHRVRTKAAAEGVTVKALILRLLTEWLGAAVLALMTFGCALPTEPTSAKPEAAHGTPTTLKVSATPGTGANAGHAAISVHVVDAYAAPVTGVLVALQTEVGSLDPTTVTTDAAGQATSTLTAPGGSVKVTATINDSPPLHTSTMVAIQPAAIAPDPTPTPPLPTPGPSVPLSVTLTASAAPLGTATSFNALITGGVPQRIVWSYGDGATFIGISNTSAHSYGAVGSYGASATVTDADGRVATGTTTAVVTDAAPSYGVTLSANPNTITFGHPNQFTLTATVTPRNGAAPPTQYEWDCAGEGRGLATTAVNSYDCFFAGFPADNIWRPRVTVRGGSIVATASTTVTIVP